MSVRRVMHGLATAVFAVFAVSAMAQTYPDHPIRWVVPWAPGGASDSLARTLTEKLGTKLGQKIVVDNRPGAGGNIGSDLVAKSAPDGYTLLQVTDANAISPSIYPTLPYDPIKDFAPITLLATGPHVIVVHPSLPVQDLQDLIKLAKEQPGKIGYATAGIGSAQHLAGEMLNRDAKIELVHIPYKGGGQAITDLLGGQVKLGILGMAPALPLIKSGRLKAIAVTGPQRSSVLPDVKTVSESGVPGFESVQWFGVAAPAGTPQAVVDRLYAAIREVMASPEMKDKIASIGAEAVVSTPKNFAAYLGRDVKQWGTIAKAMNIKVE